MNKDTEFYEAFITRSPREFFHVDWAGSIQCGRFLTRTGLQHLSDVAFNSFAEALDLHDLGKFGEKYLWGELKEWGAASRELICEWVRRERHKDEISRLHCVFGFETVSEAEHFIALQKLESPIIWKVLAVEYSGKKDMNWFEKSGTLLERLYHADCYWQGQPASDSPCWEILLHPSVYVKERLK